MLQADDENPDALVGDGAVGAPPGMEIYGELLDDAEGDEDAEE